MKEKDNSRKKYPWRRYIAMSAVAASLVLLTMIGARYRTFFKSGDGQMTSKQFYFTTDLLGDETMVDSAGRNPGAYRHEDVQEGQWHLYGGGTHGISISLRNYYDELRVTKEEITYKASVTVRNKDNETIDSKIAVLAIGKQADDQPGTEGETSVQGTLKADPSGAGVAQELLLNIMSHEEVQYDEGTTVEVNIQSTKPYKKEMKLEFRLYKVDTYLSCEIRDKVNSPYAELVIMTNVVGEDGEGGAVGVSPHLEWTEELSIDSTNNMTFTYKKDGTFEPVEGLEKRKIRVDKPLKPGESRSIYFFKQNTDKDYTRKQEIIKPDENGDYVIRIGTDE